MPEPALKQTHHPVKQSLESKENELRARLQFGVDHGVSVRKIADATAWSEHYILGFLSGEMTSSEPFAEDMERYLKHKARPDIEYHDAEFCRTTVARRCEAVLQTCHETADLGLIIGPAGMGKTKAVQDYCRRHGDAYLFTIDPTIRAIGAVIYLISKRLGLYTSLTNAMLLQKIIDYLKGSRRLLIFDESHFLSWEAFETVRRIFDGAGTGIVFAGQERLLSEMKGIRREMLWDQLFSRVGVHYRFRGEIPRQDIEMVLEKLCPGLDKKAVDFLASKAQAPGKLRGMAKLLKSSMRIAEAEKKRLTLELIKEVNSIFVS